MNGTLPVKIALPAVAAVWFGVMAGFFWTFSNTVIPGLAATEQNVGLVAMQQINVAVRNPVFAVFFFGAIVASVALIVLALFRRDGWRSLAHLVAGVVYLAGVLMVTATRNVPMNRALADLDPSASPSGYAASWLADWLFWNDIRFAASLAGFVILIVTICLQRHASESR